MDLIAPPASSPAVVTPTTATVAGGFTSKNGEWRPSYGARYGPLFAFPPRPANARTPWNPIWTARVRYRSSTSWMIGGPGAEANNGQQPNDPNRRCRRRGGLGGAIGGALGLPGC